MSLDLLSSLSLSTPELILAVGALALLMAGAYARENTSGLVNGLAVCVIAVAGLWMWLAGGQGTAFDGAFKQDDFARFMKLVTLLGSAVTLVMSIGYARAQRYDNYEYPVLVMLSTLGMMLMISANSMISLYLGFELQSLALYVVAAINRENARSSEAGLKYFVLGALGTGMMLYGISLTYGFTGSVDFGRIAEAVSGSGHQVGVLFGLVFILAGLTFKISAVPFHMWTPDVYEGAPTPVTAFFAVAPKVATMALILRVVLEAFEPAAGDWQQVIVFISIASMALGSFAAIGQRNFKRLMAYSSIGHMGFCLVGLAANSEEGVRGVVIYMRGHEGRGIGLINKLKAYRLQEEGLDTLDANLALGFPADGRDYGAAVAILEDLGISEVRAITNNPEKLRQLKERGIVVTERVPLVVGVGEFNEKYLEAKRDRMGHVLPDNTTLGDQVLSGQKGAIQ